MPGDPPLLITGGTGFVGGAVLRRLARAERPSVVCLARDPEALRARLRPWPATWSIVAGDLTDPESWADEAGRCGTVLHMAARTGKGSPAEFDAINRAGTERLLAAMASRGCRRFVFMSSVAAAYPEVRRYPYAVSKAAAERAVRASGIDWAILRPTQVFGPGSPVQAGLTRLATLPVGVCFGPGSTPMQPVDVDDLAAVAVAVAERPRLDGRVATVGGPERLPVKDLLVRIRTRAGRGPGPWVHLPVGPLQALLGAVEPFLRPLLPLTAGQLAPFRPANDGSAGDAESGAAAGAPPPRVDLDAMLAHANGAD